MIGRYKIFVWSLFFLLFSTSVFAVTVIPTVAGSAELFR